MRDAPTARLALGALCLLGCSDTTPPRFDEGAVPELRAEADRVEVSWPVATDDRAVTAYVVEVDGAEVARGPERHHTLTGVPELTSPRIAIRALDAAGHASEPIAAQITLADRTPPHFSPDARVVHVPSEAHAVALTWTAASDNVAVISYEVRCDGAVIGTTEQPHFERAELPQGSVLEVVALDAQGLRSSPLEAPPLEIARSEENVHDQDVGGDSDEARAAQRHAELMRALDRARRWESGGAATGQIMEADEGSTTALSIASGVEVATGAPRERGGGGGGRVQAVDDRATGQR